jgi:hypothetical protein
VKMNLLVPQESQKPFSLLLSIPASYTVREAILHSLEYFNGKMKRFQLKMQADCYQLIEDPSTKAPATLTPITEEGSPLAAMQPSNTHSIISSYSIASELEPLRHIDSRFHSLD